MPIQFPTSPTDGQVFSGYYYDATLLAWKASPIGAGPIAISDTAPAGAIHGDMWYKSNDGTAYIYYNDGSTFQWVEIRSEIATSRIGLVPVTPTSIAVGSGTGSVDVSGKVVFAGASYVDVRGLFTTTYNRYVVTTSVTGWSNSPTTTAIHGRLTKAGVNPSGYYYQSQYDNNNNANGAWTNGVNAAHFFMGDIGTGYNGPAYNSVFEIFNPQVSTVGTDGLGRSVALTVSFYGHGIHSFHQNSTDTQDGIYVFPTSGNFTGEMRVYGYN